jgi:hypothetical protein
MVPYFCGISRYRDRVSDLEKERERVFEQQQKKKNKKKKKSERKERINTQQTFQLYEIHTAIQMKGHSIQCMLDSKEGLWCGVEAAENFIQV